MSNTPLPLPAERIEQKILLLRGHKVMLSGDLARLYGIKAKVLLQAVRRNLERFPEDFMFQLTRKATEMAVRSRSQIVTLNRGGNVKYLPFAFTEQGVAMLSSILRSRRAVQVNIEIMRAFVRLKQMLATHADLAHKLDALEQKYDAQFRIAFDAIRELMTPVESPRKTRIGFDPKRPHPAGRARR